MGETADLLRQLASLDEIECVVVTDAQQREGEAPKWAELSLELTRGPKTIRLWLRRHDGELIIEVLREVLHPNNGGTLLQMMWQQMDLTYAALMENKDSSELRGECRGIAQAIALVQNPYKPSVDSVRKEAAERYKVHR